ncbi:MAG TPA: phospho-N-acetylmuramoyl-pentapeptide-transferase [Acidimicrobiia bacterium]
MIAVLIAVAIAFFVSVLGTPMLIRILRARNIGQQIRDDGPIAHPHEHKAGTPTMGGVAIIVAGFVGYVAAHIRTEAIKFGDAAIALWFLILGLGFVGWLDDYLGVRRARNLGLRKRGKTGGILIVAVGFSLLGLQFVNVSTHLSFTRPLGLDLGTLGWILWAVAVVYATANAVNITDGLDGLVAGSAALVFAAFIVIAFTQFRHPHAYHLVAAGSIDVAVVAAALMGACVGFLWWNAAPARVFMGDTGALALGGAMAGMGLLTKTDLLLPIIGGLYVLETCSVIAQVISFRGFGRRVLRMSPIHHHFEILGWPESTILVRFWILAGLAMALGLGFFYADFIRIPGIIE